MPRTGRPAIQDEYTDLPISEASKAYWRRKAREAGHFVPPRTKKEAGVDARVRNMIHDEFSHLPSQQRYRKRHALRVKLREEVRRQRRREQRIAEGWVPGQRGPYKKPEGFVPHNKIFDEYTDLDIPSWKKFKLRHPEKNMEVKRRYLANKKKREEEAKRKEAMSLYWKRKARQLQIDRKA